MTAVVTPPSTPHTTATGSGHAGNGPIRVWLCTPLWNRFTPLQLVVLTLATIAPLVITGAIAAALFGLITTEALIATALAAGENPGMVTFGAMFLASPIQWLTGRSQVRARKYLAIVFFLLAVSNLTMFIVETGIAATLSAPFLIAGTIAVVLSAPLFLTSSRRGQRAMGMKRWRYLHKATYLVAIALMAHVALLGDIGPGFVLIATGFAARIPAIKRRLQAVGRGRSPQQRPVRVPQSAGNVMA